MHVFPLEIAIPAAMYFLYQLYRPYPPITHALSLSSELFIQHHEHYSMRCSPKSFCVKCQKLTRIEYGGREKKLSQKAMDLSNPSQPHFMSSWQHSVRQRIMWAIFCFAALVRLKCWLWIVFVRLVESRASLRPGRFKGQWDALTFWVGYRLLYNGGR